MPTQLMGDKMGNSMKYIEGKFIVCRLPFTKDRYLVWDNGFKLCWLAHTSDNNPFWTETDWMRDK